MSAAARGIHELVTVPARRLHAEGFFLTALRYMVNFLSEVVRKKPLTSQYRDIR